MTTTNTTYLFVYGTLMRDIAHPMHDHIAANGEYAGEATFNGRLYLVRHYPGVVASQDAEDVVHGELYLLRNPDAAFPPLDDYEGCGPDAPQPPEYVRELRPVTRPDGVIVPAWIYLYNRLPGQLPRIASGRFEMPAG